MPRALRLAWRACPKHTGRCCLQSKLRAQRKYIDSLHVDRLRPARAGGGELSARPRARVQVLYRTASYACVRDSVREMHSEKIVPSQLQRGCEAAFTALHDREVPSYCTMYSRTSEYSSTVIRREVRALGAQAWGEMRPAAVRWCDGRPWLCSLLVRWSASGYTPSRPGQGAVGPRRKRPASSQ